MSGRVAVPAERTSELLEMSTAELSAEAAAITSVKKRLQRILSQAHGTDKSVQTELRGLRANTFSRDNQWHDIFVALCRGGSELESHRQIALEQYVQYLTARLELIKAFRDKESKSESGLSAVSGDAEMLSALGDASERNAAQGYRLARLQKGEATLLKDLDDGERIDVFLSRHRCNLTGHNPPLFIDQANRGYRLPPGKTTVGRDIDCGIVLDRSLRDVSRMHLVIYIDSDRHMHLTDVSSHGTSISTKYLQTPARD